MMTYTLHYLPPISTIIPLLMYDVIVINSHLISLTITSLAPISLQVDFFILQHSFPFNIPEDIRYIGVYWLYLNVVYEYLCDTCYLGILRVIHLMNLD